MDYVTGYTLFNFIVDQTHLQESQIVTLSTQVPFSRKNTAAYFRFSTLLCICIQNE